MQSFPAYPEPTHFIEFVPLPEDLPVPVRRHFRAVIGERVPVITSVVLTGRVQMRVKGLKMPVRFKMVHQAGRNHRHYFEVMLLGYPILKINEWNLDGVTRLELPGGNTVDNQPKTNSAANLGMWAEQLTWLPSVLITDPRVRWEALDADSARVIVPAHEDEDALTLHFDPATGLLRSLEAPRWREETDAAKQPWRGEVTGWSEFNRIKVANPSELTWVNDGKPWAVWHIEDIAYNVDVDDYIRASGA